MTVYTGDHPQSHTYHYTELLMRSTNCTLIRWCVLALVCLPLSSCIFFDSAFTIPFRSQKVSDAPPQIVELAKQLEGARSEDVLPIVQGKLGEGTLSPFTMGAIVRAWDVGGGVLTYNSCYSELDFESPAVTVDLRHTKGIPVDSVLFGEYKMWVLPDDERRKSPDWTDDTLGSLILKPGHYQYKFPEPSKGVNNFISSHPSGKVEVTYPAGVTSKSFLQDRLDNSVIARVKLSADDVSESYTIISERRELKFKGADTNRFQLSRDWEPR